MMSLSLFLCCPISLVKFSYWFKFHINIITGSGVMTLLVMTGDMTVLEILNLTQMFLVQI